MIVASGKTWEIARRPIFWKKKERSSACVSPGPTSVLEGFRILTRVDFTSDPSDVYLFTPVAFDGILARAKDSYRALPGCRVQRIINAATTLHVNASTLA
jgi:hypothetical protein